MSCDLGTQHKKTKNHDSYCPAEDDLFVLREAEGSGGGADARCSKGSFSEAGSLWPCRVWTTRNGLPLHLAKKCG